MKTLAVTILISVLGIESSLAQEVAPEIEPRNYWCSLAQQASVHDGSNRIVTIETDERKPFEFSVPVTEREGLVREELQASRFYTYVRYYPEQEDHNVLLGVFDIQALTLSTVTSVFGTGRDGVLRPYSRSFFYVCTRKD